MEKDPNGLDPKQDMGAKMDGGKTDLSLLLDFSLALAQVAIVGEHGCAKYQRGSWAQVSNGEIRYTAAMLRHLFREQYEAYDQESNLLHAAHIAWNALARLELMLKAEL